MQWHLICNNEKCKLNGCCATALRSTSFLLLDSTLNIYALTCFIKQQKLFQGSLSVFKKLKTVEAQKAGNKQWNDRVRTPEGNIRE